jgi:hypothetical protein
MLFLGLWLRIGFVEVFLVEWLIFYALLSQKYKTFWVVLVMVILLKTTFSVFSWQTILLAYLVWVVVLWGMHYVLIEGGFVYNLVAVGFLGLIYWLMVYQGISEGFWWWWAGNTILNFIVFKALTFWGNKNRWYEIIYT